jgi:hypothetical protein
VHVIGDSTSLTVRWERDGADPVDIPVTGAPLVLPSRGRAVQKLDRDYPDIAVLTVEAPADHPCVRMDLVRPGHGDQVHAFGYPQEGGSVRLTPVGLTYRGPHGNSPTSFWDLGADTVKPGMSGAAAFHLRTCTVGGIVVASKNTARAEGALVVPWHEVERDLVPVLAANRAFHEVDHRWNDAARMAAGDKERPRAGTGEDRSAGLAAYLRLMAELVRGVPDVPLRVTSAPPAVEVLVRRSSESGQPPFPAVRLAFAEGDCWLTGVPGAGKSRQLREWTLRLCEGLNPAPGGPIPLLVRAADLLACADLPNGDPSPPARMLSGAVNVALKGARIGEAPWLESFLESQSGADSPWLLLVDGLDEIPDARSRRRVLRKLEYSRAAMAWKCRIVVASRPTGAVGDEKGSRSSERGGQGGGTQDGTDDEPGWPGDRYELLGLSETRRDELLLGWFIELGVGSPEQSVQLFTTEVKQKGLDDLIRQPLMLVILAQLFVIERTGSLPGTRVDAYGEIVKQVFGAFRQEADAEADGVNRASAADATGESPADPAADAIYALHARLADPDGLVSQLALARYKGQADDAVEWLAAQTEDLRRRAGHNSRRWALTLADLAPRIPLLAARGHGYDFVHATLYEYLVARALSRDPFERALLLWSVTRRGIAAPGWDLPQLSYYLESQAYTPSSPLADWLYALWRDWPAFHGALVQMLRRDRWATCASVASLAWRHIPVAPVVADAVRRELTAVVRVGRGRKWATGKPWKKLRATAADAVIAATYLAMLADPVGCDELARAAADPDIGELRITAARHLIALGDLRAGDLYAAAVAAAVESPIPFERPARNADLSDYAQEMFRRRQLALEFTRTRNPKATEVLRIFLTDDRFDAKTRGYLYEDLVGGPGPDPFCADACATLLAEFAPGSEAERYGRRKAVTHIATMADPGSADRLVVIASATTVPPALRLGAALQLARRADRRAAEPLVSMLADQASIRDHLPAAWALAEIGDMRAVRELTRFTGLDPRIWAGTWRRLAAGIAKSGNAGSLEVLTALATAPAIPVDYQLHVLLALCESGHRAALDIAEAIAPGCPKQSGFLLFALADALATHHDPRFIRLLETWASQADSASPDEAAQKDWAAAIAAEPTGILGTGLYAAVAASQRLPLSVRSRALWNMIEADHPESMPSLLNMLPELTRDMTGKAPEGFPGAVVDFLADHGTPEAVPYLVSQICDPSTSEERRDRAVKVLTEMECPEAYDALALIARSLTSKDGYGAYAYYNKFTIGRRLISLRHQEAAEIITAWIDADRARHFAIDEYLLDMLLELRAPGAADVIDEMVRQQLPFTGDIWSTHPPTQPHWSRAIETLASLEQHGADVLARWTLDDSFGISDRVEALLALRALGDGRAVELRDALFAGGSLKFSTRRRVQAAFHEGQRPPSVNS